MWNSSFTGDNSPLQLPQPSTVWHTLSSSNPRRRGSSRAAVSHHKNPQSRRSTPGSSALSDSNHPCMASSIHGIREPVQQDFHPVLPNSVLRLCPTPLVPDNHPTRCPTLSRKNTGTTIPISRRIHHDLRPRIRPKGHNFMVRRPGMSSMWKTVRLPHEAASDNPPSTESAPHQCLLAPSQARKYFS